MAATSMRDRIHVVSISRSLYNVLTCLCAKFHAFILFIYLFHEFSLPWAAAILKMAATTMRDRIHVVSISRSLYNVLTCLCPKCHAFILFIYLFISRIFFTV